MDLVDGVATSGLVSLQHRNGNLQSMHFQRRTFQLETVRPKSIAQWSSDAGRG